LSDNKPWNARMTSTSRQGILATPELLHRILEKPVINHSPLPQYDYDHLDFAMNMSIERTPGGRLWSCWCGGGDSPDAFLVVATSDDDGETWAQPCLVIDPHDEQMPCDRDSRIGCLWTDPTGRLWFFFSQVLEGFDGSCSNWYIRCDEPDAEKPVWSDPVYIGVGASLNKPIVLSNGEWMLPVSLWERWHISEPFIHCYHELDPIRGANVFVSPDQGFTWGWRGCVKFPDSEFNEHLVVEREDQMIWMLSRTRNALGESFSTDFGRTWSKPRYSGIANTMANTGFCKSSRANICRLHSGRLLLVKHGIQIDKGTETRSHLAAFLSDDDGRTWSRGLLLDPRAEVSYPDIAQSPEGVLYVQYDRNRTEDAEILFARITEADIVAGRLVSEKSGLGKMVSKPTSKRQSQ
jgi:sialidase-1